MKVNFPDLRAAQRSARRQASVRRVFSKYAFRDTLNQAVRWHLFYDGQNVVSVVARGERRDALLVSGTTTGGCRTRQTRPFAGSD